MENEIKIERLAYGGEGIGYLRGKVCFVEDALPGEKVLAHILQDKKSFARAKAVQILWPSPKRVVPPCPYVEECGGCQYQHTDYPEELHWKEIQVREHLERNLKISPTLIRTIVPSKNFYGYRNSVTLHKMAEPAEEGTVKAGFFCRDNESILAISECLLIDKKLWPILDQAHAFKKHSENRTFRLSKDGAIFSDETEQFFEIKIGDQTFWTNTKSFFQNNLEMTAAIGRQLKTWGEALRPDTFVDLYAGCGTFTLLGAPETASWVCLEENVYGVKALQKNLEARNVKATILQGKVETEYPQWTRESTAEKMMVFLDPPRKGMVERLASFLSLQENVASIAYLSCHLGTLTRDLACLLKSGRWEIAEVIPFDMFPRTKHIEILTLLKRTAPK